jgi:hypothetical protein
VFGGHHHACVQVPPIAQKLTKAFEWIFHMGQNQVLDSDAMLLHVQVCLGRG